MWLKDIRSLTRREYDEHVTITMLIHLRGNEIILGCPNTVGASQPSIRSVLGKATHWLTKTASSQVFLLQRAFHVKGLARNRPGWTQLPRKGFTVTFPSCIFESPSHAEASWKQPVQCSLPLGILPLRGSNGRTTLTLTICARKKINPKNSLLI